MRHIATMLILIAGLCSFAAHAEDDRIAKLEALVKAQGEQMKAQSEQIKALQQKNAQYEGKASEIKMDASVQKAIDNAVARAGTGSKYGNSYLNFDRPDIKGTGLVFNGQFLYLKPAQSGQEYALLRNAGSAPAASHVGKVKEVELDWEAGFRLGLGYRLPYDGWDIGATYTYYRSDAASSTVAPAGSRLVSSILGSGDLGSTAEFVDLARASLDLDLDSVDVLVGRTYKPSETTSVKLYGGFTGSWIKDELKVSYFNLDPVNPTTAGLGYQVQDKIDFSGLGIKVGASGDWKLKYGLSLFGKAEAAILSGSFDIRHIDAIDINNDRIINPANELQQDSKQESNRLVPEILLSAGVAWSHKINGNLNLKVSAGYELTNYFNYISRSARTDDVNDASLYIDNGGNLGLHGFVFKIKLDF